jgi:diaminopimelate decarboxylase
VCVDSSSGLVSAAPLSTQNVAGPLCFGGDIVGRRVELPTISRGDFVVVHDTGANTLSMFSRHCSRPAPAIYGYRTIEDEVSLELLKPAESPEQVMSFWG